MKSPLADWTTAGPYNNLSWLTLAYTVLVLIALVLLSMEARDALRSQRAVRRAAKNGALEILVTSSLIRSAGRLAMVTCFLAIAIGATYVNAQEAATPGEVYWYRIVFIVSFMLAQVLIILTAINDMVARNKLFDIIEQRLEGSESERATAAMGDRAGS